MSILGLPAAISLRDICGTAARTFFCQQHQCQATRVVFFPAEQWNPEPTELEGKIARQSYENEAPQRASPTHPESEK